MFSIIVHLHLNEIIKKRFSVYPWTLLALGILLGPLYDFVIRGVGQRNHDPAYGSGRTSNMHDHNKPATAGHHNDGIQQQSGRTCHADRRSTESYDYK